MSLYESRPCEWCDDVIYPAVLRTRWAPYGLKAINANSGSVHYCEVPEAGTIYMDEQTQNSIIKPVNAGVRLDWGKHGEVLPASEVKIDGNNPTDLRPFADRLYNALGHRDNGGAPGTPEG